MSISPSLRFREAGPTDLPACIELEQASYPEDEAASKSSLQYRQHYASSFFRCAVIGSDDDDDDEHGDGETVVGFVCSTRCSTFTHESMTTHVAGGELLAIHSVVVKEEYQRQGVATAMLQEYVQHICEFNKRSQMPIQEIVLLAKKHLLAFYVDVGFSVKQKSPIVHGAETWYELRQKVSIPWNFPCWTVDGFCSFKKRGTGNPAAVVLMPDDTDMSNEATQKWMQVTAQEFNLAETAFVWRWFPKDGDDDQQQQEQQQQQEEPQSPEDSVERHFHIRYFTPTVEVPLCGHATLASASILYQHHQDVSPNDSIVFHASEDTLGATMAQRPSTTTGGSSSTARIRGQRRITMTFPSKPAREIQTKEEKDVVRGMVKDAFSIAEEAIVWMGLSSVGDLLIEVTFEALESIGYGTGRVRYDSLLNCDLYSRGVILCCRRRPTNSQEKKDAPEQGSGGGSTNSNSNDGADEVDFLSRFFAPKAGIPEDPVTGSAHCVLAPYFCPLLNKASVIGHQKSQRGGYVECTMLPSPAAAANGEENGNGGGGGGTVDRVQLVGLAVTTMAGTLQ